MAEPSRRLWPIPRELQWRDDELRLERCAVVVPADDGVAGSAVAQLLVDMVADDFALALPLVEGRAPAGKLPIRITTVEGGRRDVPSAVPGTEGYVLRVTAGGVDVVGRDKRGAQYGVATLMQLAERRGQEVVLPGVEIRDWPYKPTRMVHLFLPGVDHLSYARRYLRDFLLRYKFNGLFVELGGGVRLRGRQEIPLGWRRFVEELRAIGDTVPAYGEHVPLGPERRFAASVHTHLADGGYIEPDDLSRLAGWARDLDLDFVPEIQSLSHAYYLACVYPEIAELPQADFPDTYCPCNPRSYEILFDLMSAFVDLTKPRSVHIGHDEWRAAGLCPKCRERDTGELFGEDVLKIASWLRDRGLGIWMWGDHLVRGHNALRRCHDSGKVRYDHPSTERAIAMISEGAPDIALLNWSWFLGESDSDKVLADLGFRQIYGNFDGRRFEDWGGRSRREGVLGAEVSSWCAWEDYELGVLHYPAALHAANMLWSGEAIGRERGDDAVALELPKLRDRMRRGWETPRLWSIAAPKERSQVVSVVSACNAPLKSAEWDLSGARVGRGDCDGLTYEIVDPDGNRGTAAVVVERRHRPEGDYPHSADPIAIEGRYAAFVFWQVATGRGGVRYHAGDQTNYPRESHELLGWYEIRFEDGLTRTAEVRYGENVLAWDEGYGLLYHAREALAGSLPDGSPLVIYGLEWPNPRPAVEIESVTLHGARATPELRPDGGTSDARPMLLGITAVEWPHWEDYRPGRKL